MPIEITGACFPGTVAVDDAGEEIGHWNDHGAIERFDAKPAAPVPTGAEPDTPSYDGLTPEHVGDQPEAQAFERSLDEAALSQVPADPGAYAFAQIPSGAEALTPDAMQEVRAVAMDLCLMPQEFPSIVGAIHAHDHATQGTRMSNAAMETAADRTIEQVERLHGEAGSERIAMQAMAVVDALRKSPDENRRNLAPVVHELIATNALFCMQAASFGRRMALRTKAGK